MNQSHRLARLMIKLIIGELALLKTIIKKWKK